MTDIENCRRNEEEGNERLSSDESKITQTNREEENEGTEPYELRESDKPISQGRNQKKAKWKDDKFIRERKEEKDMLKIELKRREEKKY